MKDQITTTIEEVTPAQAEAILQEHYDRVADGRYAQRRVYKQVYMKYATDMRNGHWKPSPSPIIFDEDGNLANGQHRLEGVRQSGKTIEFTITRGWPKDVIDTEDRGKSRTVGDQLHLHGTTYPQQVAASVVAITRVCYSGKAPAVSYATVRYILDDLDMRKHISKLIERGSTVPGSSIRAGRLIGPLAFYHTVAPKKAVGFIEGLINMDMVKGQGNQLYAKYMRDRTMNDQDKSIRALCSALRLWHEDESGEQLKPTFQAIDWLAGLNKKLSGAITDMLGGISTGRPDKDK
jgi:hypothetical protein